MPPLTLAILAGVLQMHGADATIGSDNKGIEDLLAPIRGQLQEGADSPAPLVLAAATKGKGGGSFVKGSYYKATQYGRIYCSGTDCGGGGTQR